VKRNRNYVSLALALIIVSLDLVWLAFSKYAVPPLINSAYRGESWPIFNRMITGQALHPVDERIKGNADDRDNDHNDELVQRLETNDHFRPIQLEMGRGTPVEVVVFIRQTQIVQASSPQVTPGSSDKMWHSSENRQSFCPNLCRRD
jgi:hypothetical protein